VADHQILSLTLCFDGKRLAFHICKNKWMQHDVLLYNTVLLLKQGVLKTGVGLMSNVAFSPDG
jgi:Tol biopolymer transport system component